MVRHRGIDISGAVYHLYIFGEFCSVLCCFRWCILYMHFFKWSLIGVLSLYIHFCMIYSVLDWPSSDALMGPTRCHPRWNVSFEKFGFGEFEACSLWDKLLLKSHGCHLTHCGRDNLWKRTIFNTILTSPKSWLSQEDLDAGCEHSLVPMDS